MSDGERVMRNELKCSSRIPHYPSRITHYLSAQAPFHLID